MRLSRDEQGGWREESGDGDAFQKVSETVPHHQRHRQTVELRHGLGQRSVDTRRLLSIHLQIHVRFTQRIPANQLLHQLFQNSKPSLSLSLSILHKIFSHQHHRIKYHNNIHQLIFLFCFFLLSSFFSPLPSTNSSRHEATSTWARGRRSGGRRSPTSRASRTRRWKRWRGSTSSAHWWSSSRRR